MSHGELMVSPTAFRFESNVVMSWMAVMGHADCLGCAFVVTSIRPCHDV
jgi:hypothetical protein